MEARIKKHVEQAEFYKELARLEAERAIDAADVEEIIDEPASFVDEMLAALLISLRGRAEELAEEASDYASSLGLPPLDSAEVDQVIDEVESDFLRVAGVALLAAIEPARRRIQQMVEAGLSAATIAAALEAEATREAILASVYASARSAAAYFMAEISRAITDAAAELFALEEEDQGFGWVAVMDSSTCDDTFDNSCAPRHGEEMTLEEWDEVGRPGAPHLICSMYAKGGSPCRCELVPAGNEPKLLRPVSVTDAIRSGKRRAAEVFA